ncbi:MAG: hypothetical protein V4505_24835 [Pseudomonadota bacterium]
METFTANSHIAAAPAALHTGGADAPGRFVRGLRPSVPAAPRQPLRIASAWRPLLLSAAGLAALLYCSWKSGW